MKTLKLRYARYINEQDQDEHFNRLLICQTRNWHKWYLETPKDLKLCNFVFYIWAFPLTITQIVIEEHIFETNKNRKASKKEPRKDTSLNRS